jgi:hypothetical protein
MKNQPSTRIFATSVLALLTLFSVSRAFASSDYLLEIKDEKGKTHKISVKPDGSFTTPALPAGVCSFSFGVHQGTMQTGSASQGKMASKEDVYVWKIKSAVITCDIKAPRDAQSGMATGKRMHKPFVITKEYDKASPMLAKTSSPLTLGSIKLDEDCDGLTGMIVCKDANGKTMAMDDWSAPSK